MKLIKKFAFFKRDLYVFFAQGTEHRSCQYAWTCVISYHPSIDSCFILVVFSKIASQQRIGSQCKIEIIEINKCI